MTSAVSFGVIVWQATQRVQGPKVGIWEPPGGLPKYISYETLDPFWLEAVPLAGAAAAAYRHYIPPLLPLPQATTLCPKRLNLG